MKKIIILFAVGLLTQQITQAQGTIYVSNVGQPSTGYYFVASDKWEAALFVTGTNAGGYLLDSVQLGMADATGTPSGFSVMIYNRTHLVFGAPMPGSSLGTLDGSLNPVTAGTYNYTADSNILLAGNTDYFIVLTAATAIANGTYDWSVADPSSAYTTSGGWIIFPDASGGGRGAVFEYSTDNGSSWNSNFANLQFSITATPVPEPSTLGLLALGGLGLFWHRRKAKVA